MCTIFFATLPALVAMAFVLTAFHAFRLPVDKRIFQKLHILFGTQHSFYLLEIIAAYILGHLTLAGTVATLCRIGLTLLASLTHHLAWNRYRIKSLLLFGSQIQTFEWVALRFAGFATFGSTILFFITLTITYGGGIGSLSRG